MYIQKLSIDIKTNTNKDDLIEQFGLLMAFYRGNGQTQGKIESQYIDMKLNSIKLPHMILIKENEYKLT